MRSGFARLTVLAALLGMASVTAFAGQSVTATIPFAFTAGDQEFPAGSYTFEMRFATHQLSIQGPKARAILRSVDLTFQGEIPQVVRRYEIFFNHYGDQHFLSEVWIKHFGMEPIKSEAEKARQAAGESPSVVKLKVAAR